MTTTISRAEMILILEVVGRLLEASFGGCSCKVSTNTSQQPGLDS